METIEEFLISFFEQVAKKDKIHLEKIEEEKRFSVDPERWYFTLPDLHSFLQRQYTIFRSIDYKQFRQSIFDSPINQTAKLYGAEIIIADNRNKADKSRYALVWQAKE